MADKKKTGRPSIYEQRKTEIHEITKRMAKDGATNQQIADALGISLSTINTWIAGHKEFKELLRKNKDFYDDSVEDTMLKKIHGYTIEEKETKTLADGSVIETIKEKYIPPSDSLIQFWMKNRRPEKWQEKSHVEQTGTTRLEHAFDYMTDDELEKALEELQKQEKKGDES